MATARNKSLSLYHQRGTAVVELAVSLPLLLLLMLGVTEVGRALYQYNALNQATRDAIRHLANEATVGTTDVISIDAVLEAQTKNLAVYGNVAGSGSPRLEGLAVGGVTVAAVDGEHVSVAMRYSFSPLFGATLPSFGFGVGTSLAFDLQSSVIMRAL